jgi:hypothetical protein
LGRDGKRSTRFVSIYKQARYIGRRREKFAPGAAFF